MWGKAIMLDHQHSPSTNGQDGGRGVKITGVNNELLALSGPASSYVAAQTSSMFAVTFTLACPTTQMRLFPWRLLALATSLQLPTSTCIPAGATTLIV